MGSLRRKLSKCKWQEVLKAVVGSFVLDVMGKVSGILGNKSEKKYLKRLGGAGEVDGRNSKYQEECCAGDE